MSNVNNSISSINSNLSGLDIEAYSYLRTEYDLIDLLQIDLSNPRSDLHKVIYFGTGDASKFVNSPIGSGDFYGYRTVRWNYNLITVELHEQFPEHGRIWLNTYNYNDWTGWTHPYYTMKGSNEIFTTIGGNNLYTDYHVDGFLHRNNKTVIMNINISPGFCNVATWWGVCTLAQGYMPSETVYCNANGYQDGWSDPTPVAAMINGYGTVFIYSQNSKLKNFTISASWFTAQ